MRFRATFVCISVMTLLAIQSRAQETAAPTVNQIKAAFLFNFAKFVEWPVESFATTNSPIVIGILGDTQFGTDLEKTIQNKTINSRPLVVRAMPSLVEATNCHILFISDSEKKRFPEIFASLRGTTVLTVGESDRFIETGGIINFIQVDSKIRFQINDPAAKTVGLKISSKLLTLAVRPTR